MLPWHSYTRKLFLTNATSKSYLAKGHQSLRLLQTCRSNVAVTVDQRKRNAANKRSALKVFCNSLGGTSESDLLLHWHEPGTPDTLAPSRRWDRPQKIFESIFSNVWEQSNFYLLHIMAHQSSTLTTSLTRPGSG